MSSFLKVDVITSAYSQMRISGITVDPTPEDLELALDRLEDMAAEWNERNICARYNFEDEPDPNSTTNMKRGHKHAFSTNLAIRLIPDFNKQVPSVLVAQANQSLSNLSARSAFAKAQGVAYPSRMPVGSGNNTFRWQRFYNTGSKPAIDCDTQELYHGDINDYVEHFDAYLNVDEIISSFTITNSAGVTIQSSSNTDTDVLYQVKAVSGNVASVTIVITTDTGRVTTRTIDFLMAERP